MINIKLKLDFENVILFIFFTVMLFYGAAQINDYKIDIDYPQGFRATDAFQHPGYASHVMDAGNYRYNPAYASSGYDNTAQHYPPLLIYLIAMFSFLVDMDPYNISFLLVVLLASFSALVMYIIIKNFNKSVALLSLPLMPILFYGGFFIGFTWGQWGLVIGSFFLISLFWAFTKIKLKHSFIFLGLFLSGTALSHFTEFVIGIGFIFFYFIIKTINRKLKINELKTVARSLIIFIILSIHYLIIFKFTWLNYFQEDFTFGKIETTTGAFLVANLSEFSWFLPVILLGLLLALYLLFIQKKDNLALIASLYMLFFSYSNYLGIPNLAHRAFQSRFFLPIYLSFFFGLLINQIIKYSIKKINISKFNNVLIPIITIIIIVFLSFTFYEKNNPGGIMHPDLWDEFDWIKENTPKNSTLYFFYGDGYLQTGIFFAVQRHSWGVDINEYSKALQEQTIKREYLSNSNHGMLYVRQGIFKFERIEFPDSMQDICNFDYYIFDKVGRFQPIVQYNMLIERMFLKLEWMEVVHSAQRYNILKNNKPGENCVVIEN
ncbi:MAG: hypothetical protein ABH824_01040 [Nanoarchaeota archaeon]|nr:hypothetical protein [Nanoarchaeota archaeon]